MLSTKLWASADNGRGSGGADMWPSRLWTKVSGYVSLHGIIVHLVCSVNTETPDFCPTTKIGHKAAGGNWRSLNALLYRMRIIVGGHSSIHPFRARDRT